MTGLKTSNRKNLFMHASVYALTVAMYTGDILVYIASYICRLYVPKDQWSQFIWHSYTTKIDLVKLVFELIGTYVAIATWSVTVTSAS